MPARLSTESSLPHRRSVFINCPFDPAYRPLFRAMCFTIAACGFTPRCALDESDSASVRFNRILELITACEFSIHDISRVELDSSSGLPRFNMPLELGADLALRLKGPALHRRRRILVFDAVPHRYDQTLSDISGMDIEVHGSELVRIVRGVRDWLNSGRVAGPPLPGGAAISADYETFLRGAADLIAALRLDQLEELPHADFMYVVRAALRQLEAARRA